MVGRGDNDCVNILAVEKMAKVAEGCGLALCVFDGTIQERLVYVAGGYGLDAFLAEEASPEPSAASTATNDADADAVICALNRLTAPGRYSCRESSSCRVGHVSL